MDGGQQGQVRGDVAVVVPCRDERATLAACIGALRRQVPAPGAVVVVDDGSTDGSLEVARRVADVVVERCGGTIAAARNAGAAAVPDAAVVGFVDADCEAAPGWLAAGLAALADADLVGARVEAPAGGGWVGRRWAAVEQRFAGRGSAVWAANMLARREALTGVGGFDERCATGEDVDLCARLGAAGGTIAYVPAMRVVHHGFPATLSGFVARERWHASSPGWWYAASPRSRLLVAAAAAWTAAGAGAVALAVLPGSRWLRARAARAVGAWALLGGAALPALGRGVGRHGDPLRDGVLIAAWALTRATRLGRGLRRRRGPGG